MRIGDKPEGIEDVVGIVLAPGDLESLEYHLLCFVNVEFRAFDEIREIRFHERKRVKDIAIAADVGHGPEIRGLDFAQIQCKRFKKPQAIRVVGLSSCPLQIGLIGNRGFRPRSEQCADDRIELRSLAFKTEFRSDRSCLVAKPVEMGFSACDERLGEPAFKLRARECLSSLLGPARWGEVLPDIARLSCDMEASKSDVALDGSLPRQPVNDEPRKDCGALL